MIDATIKITVPPEKRNEFLQTFRAILDPIRQEQGCLSCHCYVDIEAENNTLYLFREEWRTREALETHLRSGIFRVLIGAMSLLDSPPETRFNAIASTDGMEAIKAARSSPTVECSDFYPTEHWRLKGNSPQEE